MGGFLAKRKKRATSRERFSTEMAPIEFWRRTARSVLIGQSVRCGVLRLETFALKIPEASALLRRIGRF
jgi:hypothetical protein